MNFEDQVVETTSPSDLPKKTALALDFAITWERIFYLVMTLAAFATRFWNLGARVMSHDESLHVYYSWLLAKGQGYAHNPMMHGPFLFEATAVFQRVFSPNDFTSRLVPALLGILIVVAVPILLRPWLGRNGAAVASLLLLISPYVLYYSRYIRHDIQVIAFTLLAVYSILDYLSSRREHNLLVLAVALALMLSTMEITFFYLAVFAVFLLLRMLLRHQLQWTAARASAEFDLFVVLATLGAFFSAPIALLALNPIWQSLTGQPFVDVRMLDTQSLGWNTPPSGARLWGLVVVFSTASALIGLWWGRVRWLRLFVVFAAITVPLYTTFFTNPSGLGSGLVGSLGYWLSQHDVQRGSQPWYYYLIVFPIYEYLPLLAGTGSTIYFALYWRRFSEAARALVSLLILWAFVLFVGLSIAGEKMPWLSTHFTVPLILLAAWGIGQAFDQFRWERDHTTAPNISWATAVLFLLMALMTTRTSYFVNYVNYDYTTEFIGYAHGAPGVKWLMEDVERIAEELDQGSKMIVAYDNETAWPMAWYLRDYPGFFGASPNRGSVTGAPVVVAGRGNWQKVEQYLGSDYHRYEIIRIWWPMEDYKNLTWERIKEALSDPEMRRALWDIFWARDYTEYARITGLRMEPPDQWVLEDRARVYIRKEVAAMLPGLALERAKIEDITKQPDAYATLKVTGEPLRLVTPGLIRPRGLAFAPDGTVYALDSGAARIVRLDAQGTVLSVWGVRTGEGQNPPAPGTFNEPWGVAVDSQGNVYVADTWNHRIQKFDGVGNFLLEWGVPGLSSEGPDRFWGPRAIAIAPDGNIYVTDTGNRRVAVFNPQGAFLFEFDNQGEALLDEPVGIAIDGERVLVADTWNQRVAIFDLSGDYLSSFPVQAWDSTSIDNKPYLAAGADGRIYLTDPEGYRVLVFSASGTPEAAFGKFGDEPDSFGLPNGIAISALGEVWVADAENNRLAVFSELD